VTGPAMWSSSILYWCYAMDDHADFLQVEMGGFNHLNLKMYATVDPKDYVLFQAKDVTTYTFTVDEADEEEEDDFALFEWKVYFLEGTDCNTAFEGLTVTGPTMNVFSHCGIIPFGRKSVGGVTYVPYASFYTRATNLSNLRTLPGNYTVTGSSFSLENTYHSWDYQAIPGDYVMVSTGEPFWVRDVCKDVGEAVKGTFESIGLMMLAIILFIVSAIFSCVACCCGCTSGSKQSPVGDQVIGQPVGSR